MTHIYLESYVVIVNANFRRCVNPAKYSLCDPPLCHSEVRWGRGDGCGRSGTSFRPPSLARSTSGWSSAAAAAARAAAGKRRAAGDGDRRRRRRGREREREGGEHRRRRRSPKTIAISIFFAEILLDVHRGPSPSLFPSPTEDFLS